MSRTGYIFSIATIMLILLGLIVAKQRPIITGWNGWTHGSWSLRTELPVFVAALICCVLAALYSANIPFSETLTRWHPWLSVMGLAMLCLGIGGLLSVITRAVVPGNFGLAGALYLAIGVGGISTFLLAQVWLAVELIRTVILK